MVERFRSVQSALNDWLQGWTHTLDGSLFDSVRLPSAKSAWSNRHPDWRKDRIGHQLLSRKNRKSCAIYSVVRKRNATVPPAFVGRIDRKGVYLLTWVVAGSLINQAIFKWWLVQCGYRTNGPAWHRNQTKRIVPHRAWMRDVYGLWGGLDLRCLHFHPEIYQ